MCLDLACFRQLERHYQVDAGPRADLSQLTVP